MRPFEAVRSLADGWQSAWSLYRMAGASGLWQRLLARRRAARDRVRYQEWIARHAVTADALVRMKEQVAAFECRPIISIITPVHNTPADLLRACIESVRTQVYDRWELCVADDGSTAHGTREVLRAYDSDLRVRQIRLRMRANISAASNAALSVATGEFIALLDHDDELAPEALYEVVKLLNEDPNADVIYSDEDKIDRKGRRCEPYFKPDWSPEHFLACMYTCHLMVARRSLVQNAGGFRTGYEGAQDYDLMLRLMERTASIRHIPKVLYHWRQAAGSAASGSAAKPWAVSAAQRALEDHVRRSGASARVRPGAGRGVFRIRRAVEGTPLVSILIATGPGVPPDILVRTARSIGQNTRYSRYELLLPAHDRLLGTIGGRLDGIPHRLIAGGTPSESPAAVLNRLARAAVGQHLAILLGGAEPLADEWLEALLEFSQQTPIGAVGGRVISRRGRLLQAGTLLGICGVAAPAFAGWPASCLGYKLGTVSVRNYSAVSAACMMTRRALFEEAAGFDEHVGNEFFDVDYCLRLRQRGYRIVFTPYARVTSLAGEPARRSPVRAQEESIMRERWATLIARDPYYNPNLTRTAADYSVGEN